MWPAADLNAAPIACSSMQQHKPLTGNLLIVQHCTTRGSSACRGCGSSTSGCSGRPSGRARTLRSCDVRPFQSCHHPDICAGQGCTQDCSANSGQILRELAVRAVNSAMNLRRSDAAVGHWRCGRGCRASAVDLHLHDRCVSPPVMIRATSHKTWARRPHTQGLDRKTELPRLRNDSSGAWMQDKKRLWELACLMPWTLASWTLRTGDSRSERCATASNDQDLLNDVVQWGERAIGTG